MRGVAFSGGGVFGAVQVGALLSESSRHAGELEYDFLSGVSVGSLNAAFLAQFKVGDFPEGILQLEDLWEKIEGNKSIYKQRCFGIKPFDYIAAYFAKGIYNTKPLKDLIDRELCIHRIKDNGRKLRVGTVNLHTENYLEVTEDKDNLKEWIIASSSFPGFFPPAKIEGKYYTDGGVREIVPSRGLINSLCSSIDIYLSRPVRYQQKGLENTIKTIKDVLVGVINATYGEIAKDDLEPFRHLVDEREIRVFAPSPNLIFDKNPLDFSPRLIRALIEIGKAIEPVKLKDLA